MSSDLFYNPTGHSFTGKQPMKSVEKLSYLNSIEDLYRYNGAESIGAYYPVRTLPSIDIDMDAEWPIVMPAGCIVSVLNIADTNAYDVDHDAAGIRATGLQYVSIGVDDVALEKSINYMYPKDIAGLIVPCNGGVETDDSYTANCGTYGILTLSGEVAEVASDVFTRTANVPVGIVNHRVFADMRLRYLNYDARQGSNADTIALGGVISIPAIAIFGAGVTATVLAAVRTAVNAKHQYLWVTGASKAACDALVYNGSQVISDPYGRFTNAAAADASDRVQIFGRVVETRTRVPWAMDEIIDSVPGSGMKGTDTGGFTARLYNFITSILASTAVKGLAYSKVKANVKASMYTNILTDTATVSVRFGAVDIAFGTLR